MANPLAPVTLTADTSHSFTLDSTSYSFVDVVRFEPGTNGTDEIFVSTNGTTPTVDGAFEVLTALTASLRIPLPSSSGAAPVIKLISHGTPKVSVAGR